MFREFARRLFRSAEIHNHRNILDLTDAIGEGRMLDLGCDDGERASCIGKKAQVVTVIGLDIEAAPLQAASRRGIYCVQGDLARALPFADEAFAFVHANQVIEHLPDVDLFIEEIYRILRPGGYAVISTENLSSWHNIVALSLGRQAFSQHISARTHVGNEWAIHAGESLRRSWTHMKIFSWHGLRALVALYGLHIVTALGAGYYPLPGRIAILASRIDPLHTHFISIRASKPIHAPDVEGSSPKVNT